MELMRNKAWSMGATATLLALSLVLSACGGGDDASDSASGPQPVGTEVTEGEGIATPDANAGATIGDDDETPEAEVVEAEGTVETQVITETGVITDVDIMTNVTTLVTTTEVITNVDVMSVTEEIVPTPEVVTDTVIVTDTIVVTDTEIVTETEGSTQTGGNTAAVAAAGAAGTAMGISGAQDTLVSATAVRDYDFQNQGGEVSGDIEDLMLDLSTGNVLFAFIEYGGFLDLGDKDIVVPLSAFTTGEGNEWVLNFDEQALENYPDVGNEWPDTTNPAWDDEVSNFWQGAGIQGMGNMEQASNTVARASELVGTPIADGGNGAGSIVDILVNLATGRAEYALVGFDGMGADAAGNDGPVAIPFTAFNTSEWQMGNELGFAGEIGADAWQNAPRFNMTGEELGADWNENARTFWNDLGFGNNQ